MTHHSRLFLCRALEEVRPYLIADGGNVEVVFIDKGAPPPRARLLRCSQGVDQSHLP